MEMNIKQILISIVVSLISLNSIADENWIPVVSSKLSKIDINVDSIKKITIDSPKATHKAWLKMTMNNDDETRTSRRGDEFISLNYFDCNNQLIGTKSLTIYRNNDVINTQQYSSVEMRDPIPGSTFNVVLNYVCSQY